MSSFRIRDDTPHYTILTKLQLMSWGLVVLVCAIAAVGVMLLYSAGGGSWEPWASRQLTRFATGFVVMLLLALVDIRTWMKLAYPIYAIVFALLIVVEMMGHVGMGAERWINLGPLVIQPSELMKIALVLALARYFHGFSLIEVRNPLVLIVPLLLILAPVGLVLMQPNLGTAMLLILTGGAVLFATGVRLWKFAIAIALGAVGDPDRLGVPARLPEEPRLHLPGAGARPARRRLQHHAVEDRARLRRPVRQGLHRRHAEPADVPAGEAHRLHLRGAGRGVRHGGGADPAVPLHHAVRLRADDRAQRAAAISPGWSGSA